MKINLFKDITSIKSYIRNLVLVLTGCTVMGLGYSLFLIPYHFVPGGVSGISIIINYLLRLPVDLVIIFLNLPVFLLSYRFLGKKICNHYPGRNDSVFLDDRLFS